MKHFYAIIVAFLLTTLTVWADDGGSFGDGLAWAYNSTTKTLTVTGTGDIPAMGEGNNEILWPWNDYKTEIEHVVIGKDVTRIGHDMLKNHTKLKDVTFEDGSKAERIYQEVFKGCTSLTSVTLPEGLKDIGSNVFEGCTSLESIVIPPLVTQINHHTFNGCSSLTSITLPEGLKSIVGNAFDGCI